MVSLPILDAVATTNLAADFVSHCSKQLARTGISSHPGVRMDAPFRLVFERSIGPSV